MDLAENLAPCTYNQGGTCFIFDQLNDINGLLRQVKLELRETSPGTLSLTQAPHLRLGHGMMSGQNAGAWHLLDAVLQQHLCVISICIDERKEPTGIPIDIIIRKVPSLVMLRLRAMVAGYQGLISLAGALTSGHRLQNLRLEAMFLNADCVSLLCSYFSTTAMLETLSLAHTHIDPSVADNLFNALEKNSTIRTLLLSTCLCYLGDYMGHGTQLAACLVGNKSLRTLILDRCCFDCVPGLQVIMDTLRCARQLLQLLTVDLSKSSTVECRNFFEAVRRNNTLRKVTVVGLRNEDAPVGTKQNQRCAEAFQRVCNTPGLLAYVMETASIGEFQAAFAIRAALSKNGEEDKSF
ncbi:hypothetical protein HPB52_012347 [Rhipicephalus sanguineus]|uniref:Uncharacterized protein n=1 Tax=Rhipicephalus sanguineus TaxID=34632 RepID=A0A9D4T9S6_RHISA|nr:hypothetical protein HPB52_012347 [Rhipicephalus sanguineus]